MTDQNAATSSHAATGSGVQEALEQVITAARAHLAAVQAADGALDDDQVWRSYVTLNNTSFDYDQLLLEAYGEVTPWETERIDPGDADPAGLVRAAADGQAATDGYPSVLSVRQRRDFQVPSVAALLAAATDATRRLGREMGDDSLPVPESVPEALLALVQAGDGSLASLDVPALEPLEGVVTVTEVSEALNLATSGDGAELFETTSEDRLVARLDEHPYLDPADLDDDNDGALARPAGAETVEDPDSR